MQPTDNQTIACISLILVITSVSTQVFAQTQSMCQAASIRCPISTGCNNPGDEFQRNRISPVDGVVRNHNGTDFPVPLGTPIVAAASGVVERSYNSPSYGHCIVLRHDDGGATLYAHLQQRLVEVSSDPAMPNRVTAGQQIGTANSTGRSTGNHLHLEYVPNGVIFQSPNRIDPRPCIGNQVMGSIRLSDNGSAADDAFRAAVDGFVVGETAIGQSNNLAVSNLISGDHVLTITAIVAPDNAGTLQIDLSDGWTFSDGSMTLVDTLTQNEARDYVFVVPAPAGPSEH